MFVAALIALIGGLGVDEHCTLDDGSDLALCTQAYWRTRIIAAALPGYVVSTDGQHFRHGLSWTLAVDVPRDGWSDYFSLGTDPDKPAPTGIASMLGVAGTLRWYPLAGLEGQLVLRARILSLFSPDVPIASALHLTVAAGASWGTVGFAPRIELRARIGHHAWGGLTLAVGFQPYIWNDLFVGDASVGLDAPWVWWW